jgi:hypothetical protein
MFTDVRMRYLWCVLTGGMLWMSIFPSSNSIVLGDSAYSLSRWVHFLVYALVAAIPFTAWRRKSTVLLSLAIAILGFAFELQRAYFPGHAVQSQNVFADMFGIAAGILLGLNIRMMRNPAKSHNQANPDSSRPTTHEV